MNKSAEERTRQDGGRPSFLAEEPAGHTLEPRPWKLLIVDDEPEVHSVTRLALSDFRFDERSLQFISAYSGTEAREVLANDPEIAVVLLDVVMETDDAGLQVVQYVRRILGNNFVRIILRTGHPGAAPERRVIKAYDINDYRAKTELTQDRMYSLMYTSLRAYKYMTAMAAGRRHTTALATEYRSVLDRVSGLLRGPTGEIETTVAQLLEAQGETPELGRLREAGTALGRIVEALDRLGSVTRPDSEPEEFDANAVLQQVLERLAPEIKAHHALIRHGELPHLEGFPDLFGLLLEQLLSNALQHHDTDQPSIEIHAEAKGKDWQFTIADTGRGIPIDRQDRVFEAFAGADDASGGGIGLALCRRVVALHGGRIWVEARSGGGSLFGFTLPAGGVPDVGL